MGTCVFSGAVYPLSRQTCFCRDTTGAGDAFVAGLLAGLADSEYQQIPDSLNESLHKLRFVGSGDHG